MLLLPGCVVSLVADAAVTVVKAPFQLAGAVVDTLTTSQAEADQNAGKKARKAREAEEKAQKIADKRALKAQRAAQHEAKND